MGHVACPTIQNATLNHAIVTFVAPENTIKWVAMETEYLPQLGSTSGPPDQRTWRRRNIRDPAAWSLAARCRVARTAPSYPTPAYTENRM